MRIEVTAEDIAAANKWRKESHDKSLSTHCPVARAAQRVLGDRFRSCGAHNLHVVLDQGTGLTGFIPLPPEAVRAVERWDFYEGMEPLSFEVEA
jgi:hypothetical protein